MRDATPDLNDMRVFAAVGARQIFTGAGKFLGLPKATVSRRITALEKRLGVRLLLRATRKVSVTDAGRAFLERCLRIEDEISDAEAAVVLLADMPFVERSEPPVPIEGDRDAIRPMDEVPGHDQERGEPAYMVKPRKILPPARSTPSAQSLL